jgi:hypothetical protein
MLGPDDLEDLERAWALPSDATRIERLLAYQPLTGAGQRHRTMLVTRRGRDAGLTRSQP